MTLFERIENALGGCREEKITLHMEGDWVELRIHGLHPILQLRILKDCIFRRHIASRLRSHFEETGIPLLVCGPTSCVYYSGPDIYRVMKGSMEDNLCRVVRGGISRDEMFLASALEGLSLHYLPQFIENLDLDNDVAIEFARFMGFDTALFPEEDRRISGRYLLFRWLSLYFLYRMTSMFRNDPVLLPATEEPGLFIREMWDKYFSHLESLSDMKSSIGSLSSPDIGMLSSWEQLPSYTADIHWITGFAGETLRLHHVLSIATMVGEEEVDILTSVSRFIPEGKVAVYTPRFGLAALQIYRERRAAGLDHREAVNSMTIFTPPGAGEIFQSTVLNLAGEGIPYRPEVIGTEIPPMKWGEYAALLRRNTEGRPFSTILMDWRGREDVGSLSPLVDYLWDVASDRIILLLNRDERTMEAMDPVFRSSRVEVMITHSGSSSVAFLITGRGRPSMNYTKMVHLKSPVERDMAEVIENAENRLDSSMVRLNIPVRGARFYYYRDTAMWLITSLQEKFLKWGGPMLALVPGYVWKAFSTYRWNLLKDLARVHTELCDDRTGRKDFDILISPERHGLEPIGEILEPCRGLIGIQVRDRSKLPLIRWFLRSRMAHVLHGIFGIRELPVPDLNRYEGNPDRFLSRSEGDGEYFAERDRKKGPTVSELVELVNRYIRESKDVQEILKERVFDDRLRARISRAYFRKFGKPRQEAGGSRLF